MKTLRDLTEHLVSLDGPLTPEDESVKALTADVHVPPGYVWPDLRDWIFPEGSRILLIEAPGAVGKSAAANALAATLNWPLIDAAHAQVGSYSLSGLIQDALGFNSPFIGEVMAGRAGLVIDALDEAHLKAGTANFLAFLDNVRKLAGRGSGEGLSIVLLSRPDTAELVELFFASEGAPLANAKVSFFSYEQALSYIHSFMARMHEQYPGRDYDSAVKYPGPFEELAQSRMREIASALLTEKVTSAQKVWLEVNGFLGYAPVLSVLGEFLAVPNPHKEQQILGSASAAPKGILLRIIDELLEREQAKFKGRTVDKMRALLAANESWDGFEGIYSPQEQSVRLVSHVLGVDIAVEMPATMPASLRETYEKHATQFMGDHPFLAGKNAVNVVFSDFIMAKAAIDPACAASLKSDPRHRITGVGPFFYQFVHEFATSSDDGYPQIPENLVPVLVQSQNSSSMSKAEQLFSFLQGGGDALLELKDTMSRSGANLRFTVGDLSGAIHFTDRISRGLVVTDVGVIIGSKSQRFILGPSAAIVAKEINLDAEIISVDPGVESAPPSLMDAETIIALGPLSIEAPRINAFVVYCKEPLAALRPYSPGPSRRSAFIGRNDYMNLRAILRSFRQQAGESPSVFDELLEQRIVKNNSVRRRYLDRLQELELVYRRGSHYYLDVKKLSLHGFTIRDMDSGNPNDAVLNFIALLDRK
ncbi:hypothetical protein [Actinoplanes sp. NPDC049265]|uniref:hypothetical protein n=1 Tax=Actinoplanes sp. NPDC049265 TaxID=3363902 RepID=UPI0037213809